MTAPANNQNLTARQQQRMLHFLGRYRVALVEYIENGSVDENHARELVALDKLVAEVQPIIWPKPVVPPGLHDRNGNTR